MIDGKKPKGYLNLPIVIETFFVVLYVFICVAGNVNTLADTPRLLPDDQGHELSLKHVP